MRFSIYFTLCSSSRRIFSRKALPLSDLESIVLICSSSTPVSRRGTTSISFCLLRVQMSGRLILYELSSLMIMSETLLIFSLSKARLFLSAMRFYISCFFLMYSYCFSSSQSLKRRMDSSTLCLSTSTSFLRLSICYFRWWFIFSTNLAAFSYLGISSSCSVLFLRIRERCYSCCLLFSYKSTSFSYSISFYRFNCNSFPWEACMLLELLRIGLILDALQRECSLALSLRRMAGRGSQIVNDLFWIILDSLRSVFRYFLLAGCSKWECGLMSRGFLWSSRKLRHWKSWVFFQEMVSNICFSLNMIINNKSNRLSIVAVIR